jgi:DNA-binding MarR family transcriptional regulator
MSATPHTTSVRADDLGRLHEYSSLEILRTAAVIEHFVTQTLKEYGLTMTQYNVLRILRGAGTQGLCRNEVGRRMIAPMPDATRLIDRLIAAGYAKKGKDPHDMRFTVTRITDEGLTILSALDQPIRDTHTCLMRHLSEEDLQHLSTILTSIRNQP